MQELMVGECGRAKWFTLKVLSSRCRAAFAVFAGLLHHVSLRYRPGCNTLASLAQIPARYFLKCSTRSSHHSCKELLTACSHAFSWLSWYNFIFNSLSCLFPEFAIQQFTINIFCPFFACFPLYLIDAATTLQENSANSFPGWLWKAIDPDWKSRIIKVPMYWMLFFSLWFLLLFCHTPVGLISKAELFGHIFTVSAHYKGLNQGQWDYKCMIIADVPGELGF